ncbi:MAG: HAD family hydrolase [Acutalibacteraceae bacterium]
MEQKALFWDFDGTLTYCHHVWSSSLMRVLWEYEEAESVTLEQIRPLTHHGYPWEEPDEQAHRFRTSEGFWGYMEEKFAAAFRQLGLSPQRAREAAGKVRPHILNPHHYFLYPDTLSTLQACRSLGYQNHLLSNNYPELPALMQALGMEGLFDTVTVSALDGCSKPWPKIFATARQKAGNPACCVMIGDNPVADIEGGRRAGMKTILVHRDVPCGADAVCATLGEIPPLLSSFF